MRPRTVPDVRTVSLNVSAPSVGEVRFEMPPMEMPALLGKPGKVTSASAPTTMRFGSM